MSGLEIKRKNIIFVVKCLGCSHYCESGHFTEFVDWTKKARAKCTKLMFIIVKYANLWRSCHCSCRGSLSYVIIVPSVGLTWACWTMARRSTESTVRLCLKNLPVFFGKLSSMNNKSECMPKLVHLLAKQRGDRLWDRVKPKQLHLSSVTFKSTSLQSPS